MSDEPVRKYRTMVSPEMAARWLELNTDNRPVSKANVDRIAKAIRTGAYQYNADPIRLNCSTLIDGQHRLIAVIQTGMAIDTEVVEGLPSSVYATIDIGLRRTGAQHLGRSGEQNVIHLASSLGWIDRYLTNRVNQKVTYTNGELDAILASHPEVRRSVTFAGKTKKLVSPSMFAACHYLFSRKDEELADAFVKQVISGHDLAEDSPAYKLREVLMNNALRNGKGKLKVEYLMAVTIKAWNALRDGRPLAFVRHTKDESFPIVK